MSSKTGSSWLGRVGGLMRSGFARGLLLVAVFAVGFGVHWLFGTPRGERTEAAAGPTEAAAEVWTCSMHPQIRQPEPGDCPICGMDLIPVASGGSQEMTGLRQLTVTPAARALMNIQVTPVQRRSVTAVVRMVGKVEYDETRLGYITAWVPGRLDRLYVDYTGIEVQQGDHMVYIYSPELYAAQETLIEEVRKQRERGESFFATGGIDLIESTREKLRLLGMTPEQIAEIEASDRPSDHMTIYSPMSGIVIHKNKQEGDYVQTGDRIYTVADLSQVWIKMDAYESDLVWLRYGQEVEFMTEAYPGETFIGRIAFIDPVLNEQTRTVKVRVNVPNEEGKLKPEMFVRAVVRAGIAGGGRVMDPDLAGKWISPMHPEIVKDQPGTCDICGMPLVRAETLGYVTPETRGEPLPLVIPVSAALLTGTRAIVYVEDPTTEQPTFHGREVVLGPRAGDFYIVEHGLEEGELVVTRGNFKIDSALQILAKPSMMTPQGGGGGGGHDHGAPAGGAPSDEETSPGVELPTSVARQLADLQDAYAAVQGAVASEDLAAIRSAFVEFGAALRDVDAEALEGHARMLWDEFSMLMSNDVVEGRAVITEENAERVLAGLSETMQRVDEQFGLAHAGHVAKTYDVPPEFQERLGRLWEGYLQLGDALASDDAEAAEAALPALTEALENVDMELLDDPAAHEAWMREQANLEAILESFAAASDIQEQREAFKLFSGEMQVLVLQFGVESEQPVYELHCPMAFGNTGAMWLQDDDQTRNPYFGSRMLKCADRVDRIAGADDAAEHEHSESHEHEHE